MSKVADLHVHTYLSDGTFSPEKVVEHSNEKGLSAIAITDHDCCLGIDPAIAAAKDIGMEIIPGVELTAELDGEEIHVLGYFIDWQDKAFLKKLDEISGVRQERARKILEKLRAEGIEITGKELVELSGPGSVGRLHIAHLLAKKGVVSSVSEAFTKYIGNNGPCYVKKFKLLPKEAVDMIKGVGGIAVLAHPSIIDTRGRPVEEVIGLLVGQGIEGIEAYHSDYSVKGRNEFVKLAEKYNLLVTGGSDCHGLGKKEVLIGKVKLPYILVERMKEYLSGRG